MSAIKQELISYINNLPDYKLYAFKPMFELVSLDEVIEIEKVDFDDLDDDDKLAVLQAREEYLRGETVAHEDIDWD